MNKAKLFMALTGLLTSLLIVRRIRHRRSSTPEEPKSPVVEAREEAGAAAEHASEAAGHARKAGAKTGEAARERLKERQRVP